MGSLRRLLLILLLLLPGAQGQSVDTLDMLNKLNRAATSLSTLKSKFAILKDNYNSQAVLLARYQIGTTVAAGLVVAAGATYYEYQAFESTPEAQVRKSSPISKYPRGRVSARSISAAAVRFGSSWLFLMSRTCSRLSGTRRHGWRALSPGWWTPARYAVPHPSCPCPFVPPLSSLSSQLTWLSCAA